MRVLKENGKRRLVVELGPYFDTRYAIYEKEGDVHCFHTHDLDKAIKQWERIKDYETWAEYRRRTKPKGLTADVVIIDELPFM